MDRKYIVVGDAPACGGTVLPFVCRPTDTIDGCQKALVGGRVFCAVCNSVGFIAKAGGLYRPTLCGAELALEGDMVECQCPVPSLLVSTKQNRSRCDDRSGIAGDFDPSRMGLRWYCPNPAELTDQKKVVEVFAKYTPAPDVKEQVCPNMPDAEFFTLMTTLITRAIRLTERRLSQLELWDEAAKSMVHLWFGDRDEKTRVYVADSLRKCKGVLGKFTKDNFVRHSESKLLELGCISANNPDAAAEVCKKDTKSHTIFVKKLFCDLRPMSGEMDSKLSTIIHEAAHFDDGMGVHDIVYTFTKSLDLAKRNPEVARTNPDNIAGYVVWGTNFNT